MFGLSSIGPALTALGFAGMLVFFGLFRFEVMRVDELKARMSACQMANSDYETKVAQQTKSIDDYVNRVNILETEAAANAAQQQEAAKVLIKTIHVDVVPKACEEAIKWQNDTASSLLSHWR